MAEDAGPLGDALKLVFADSDTDVMLSVIWALGQFAVLRRGQLGNGRGRNEEDECEFTLYWVA